MDEPISEALARRDRFRKALNARRTPQERLAAMRALQESAVMSPEGYAHFMRRNFKARAIDASKYASE